MSCQVYKYDQEKIDASEARYDELGYYDADYVMMASSHNGLLYGLIALTRPAEDDHKVYNNDTDITLEQVEAGVRNYEDRENAPAHNQRMMAHYQATRPDHLDDAYKVLIEAKAGGYALRLG